MSAFEVALTPPRIQNARKASTLREPTQVVLAPFSAKSIVTFEDVPVTKTAKRNLQIHNPTDDILKVLITKIIKTEANVAFEWTSKEIPARSFASLELVWSPQVEWATREVIQFTDNRNFKKDVAVVLKAVDKSKTKNLLRKPAAKKAPEKIYTRKLVIKSPSPRSKQRARLAVATLHASKRNAVLLTSIENRVPKKVLGTQNRESNCPVNQYVPVAASAYTNGHANIHDVSFDNYFQSQVESKENMRPPSTPPNVSSIFDSIKFTPSSNRKVVTQGIDYLASMPTPTSNAKDPLQRSYALNASPLDLSPSHRPLDLTATISDRTPVHIVHDRTKTLDDCQTPRAYSEPYPLHMQQTPVIVYNQHGDNVQPCIPAKLSMTFDRSPSPLLRSPNGRRSPYLAHVHDTGPDYEHISSGNRTRLLSPAPDAGHLYVIEEEQSESPVSMGETFVQQSDAGQHERTYNVVPAENLGRDVNLIASPLRKKFQSMKDLSCNSNNMSLEQQILRNNQGSMPNLHKLDHVKSIENNRYFYQSIEKDLQVNEMAAEEYALSSAIGASMCSIRSAISSQSVAFQETEILAQSSRFNIHEAGRTRPSATVVSDCYPPSTSFYIDSNAAADGNNSTSFSSSPTSASAVCRSSPVFTKPGMPVRPAKNVSIVGRPSVIASTGSTISPNSAQKRARDDALHSSQRSLTKESPPKRLCMDSSVSSPRLPRGQSFRIRTWAEFQPKKLPVPKVPMQKLVLKKASEERVVLYDPELHLKGVINPDPFAATTTLDPFLSATMFLDERCVDTHEIHFKKWLNALVAIPEDINDGGQKLDFGKLFNEVKKRDVVLAPSKEDVSSNYLTKSRLDCLRQTAIDMYTSNMMRGSLEKLLVHIERKQLQIRRDRNLHQDVVLQREILELLLNFNPLWLRIGLEVVFGERIQMQNNHDVVSLSAFVMNRLFRDKYLEAKYPRIYAQSEQYAEHIKKFTLKKFLCLLCFLDEAKRQKIIKHNPCLFLKNSTQKKTKEILLKFSSSLLGNIGDIQRDLRRINIEFTHEQTYIDEFDYAFRNLAIDLRDGVRLTKVMEIILLREDLTCQLRVPAISRTQRVHNVGVALKALQGSGFNLTGNITPADIADGHREKTLSLLWQIIYIFRAPKFNAAASVIQNWWRQKGLMVTIRRRIRERKQRIRENAASRIQAAWRGYLERQYTAAYRQQRTQAAVVIQSYVRRHLAIKNFHCEVSCVIFLQHRIREMLEMRKNVLAFQTKRQACIRIQKWYHRKLFVRRIQSSKYVETKQATVKIQTWFRACRLAREQHTRYLELKLATITVQTTWRAVIAGRKVRKEYVVLKMSVMCVQRRYRALIAMRQQRIAYGKLKTAAVNIQARFRANQQMKVERKRYLTIKNAAITIQQHWRAVIAMRKARTYYIALKNTAIVVQRRFRANTAMVHQRNEYLRITLATMIMQHRYRAQLDMRKQRREYLALKNACIVIQQRFRAKMLARQESTGYGKLRDAAIVLQQRWRAKTAMEAAQQSYNRLHTATVTIQTIWRATLQMRKERSTYLTFRRNVTNVQRRFRARQAMIGQVTEYSELKQSVVCVQSQWRAQLAMRKERQTFVQLKTATICIQRHLRATLQMREQRQKYELMKKSATIIQERYRSTICTRHIRVEFLRKRAACVSIQQFYRGYKQMQQRRARFQLVRQATITIQQRYLAHREMTIQRTVYSQLVRATRIIQIRFRAKQQMKLQRAEYVESREAAIKIQRHFRAYLEMKRLRNDFLVLRTNVTRMQTRFRANQIMKVTLNQYQLVRCLVICIQRKFRARLLMREARGRFLQMKMAAIAIQQAYRAHRLCVAEQKRYTSLRSIVTVMQARIRGYQARERYQALMTPEMVELRQQHKAAKLIQSVWRGHMVRRQRPKKLVAICENARKLQKTANSANILRTRICGIVRFLKQRYNTNEALTILRELEFISRTVPHTLIDDSRFIASFCYGMMRQAIRSEIDKHLISLCCKIILNLARYEGTKENAFQISSFETVAQILARWCDKDCDIFNILCTVIWVFVQCPLKNQHIRDFMHTHEAVYLLRETKKLTLRKEIMKRNVKQQYAAVLSPRELRKLPMLETNFGVNTANNYIFNSSVFALETILSKLNIQI